MQRLVARRALASVNDWLAILESVRGWRDRHFWRQSTAAIDKDNPEIDCRHRNLRLALPVTELLPSANQKGELHGRDAQPTSI
jgi:hypothetical protein